MPARTALGARFLVVSLVVVGLGAAEVSCKHRPAAPSSSASEVSAGEGRAAGGDGRREPAGCTKLACTDQLRITVTGEQKAFPPGFHRIDVTVDGTELSCGFTLPAATPGETLRTISAECQPGLTTDVGPATTCTTTHNGASVSQTCSPVPGRIKETIRLAGMPKLLTVTQVASAGSGAHAEHPILERSDTPRYGLLQPNGQGCDPICHQAMVDWTIP